MRWKSKQKPVHNPKYGDTELRTRFLLFPKKLENEWRWFETTTWKRELIRVQRSSTGGRSWYETGRWVDRSWYSLVENEFYINKPNPETIKKAAIDHRVKRNPPKSGMMGF